MRSVSVGCDRLDALLCGGVPENRSLLVTGEPGTGKTTLGMQFLQAGLDRGETCLLVSTEQTVDELRDTFEPYPFDLDAQELTVVTVNAEPGPSVDSGEDLVVRTIEGGDRATTEWFDLPFTRENVVHYLSAYSPQDRVVLDSVSGLRPITENRVCFWRSTYDLIRLFSDSFGATSLLTASGVTGDDAVASDLVRYATHGTVQLDWGEVDGGRHRFLRVTKLRGRDHDDRRHKLLLTDEGVRVAPGTRTQAAPLLDHDHLSTGMPALDEVLGGGLVRGGFSLVTHDGATGYYTLNTRMLAAAADAGMTLAVALPAEVTLDQLDQYWQTTDWDVRTLMNEDRLLVLELAGNNGLDHRNALQYDPETGLDWRGIMEACYERSGPGGLFALIDTEPLCQTVPDETVREVRYEAATSQSGEGDVVVYTVNPNIQTDELVAFLVDASTQTMAVHRDDDGLEWFSLRKSPTGEPGASRLVSYTEEPPHVDFV